MSEPREPVGGGPELPRELAILVSPDAVLYPGMLLPMQVSDERLVQLLSDAASAHQPIGLFAPRPSDQAAAGDGAPTGPPEAAAATPPPTPRSSDLAPVGTAASIVRLLKLPDGSLQVLLQGLARVALGEITQREPYLRAAVLVLVSAPSDAGEPGSPAALEAEAAIKNLRSLFERLVQLSPNLPAEVAITANNIDQPGPLADFVAANANLEPAQRQAVLEELDPLARVRRVSELATRELEVLEIGSRIQSQIRESMDKQQREYYLRQQLQAIRRELGETDEAEGALADLRARLDAAGLPDEARREADRELNRLASIPTASPENNMVRTYLEWLADLPWQRVTPDRFDLAYTKRVLDEDHHDLDRVKDRILEYLAVMQLRAQAEAETAERGPEGPAGDEAAPETPPAAVAAPVKGPILCLVGPPGVGKTSIAQSTARALGRHFVRMSLGGVRDEAEIRGFRRTYIGAQPGRIIQGLRRAGTRNPVFVLDEIDKLGADWRGDPSSALLEVLDPAQNSDFRDHYLDVPFDLSAVLFIATANVLDTVPPALRDRMEVIDLPGYTEDDKVQIARRYLVPRQLRENGLEQTGLRLSDSALRTIVRSYTREAGVRNLEREIATIARKTARRLLMHELRPPIVVGARQIPELLGPPRFQSEVAERSDEVGIATGLAWTPVGGEVLLVEARIVPGKGSIILTGQLGDVMRESAQAALTYARSRAQALGLGDADPLADRDLHVHVPGGAVPKDGPSAGITMATAIVSALTRRPVDHSVGMTGEITLRGRVLPIGGLKEKLLAAERAGLRRVLIPRDNRKDLEEVPARVRRVLQITPVGHMDEVLNAALRPEVRREQPALVPARRRGGRRTREPVAASA
jgi:ATP-dependent Lon protease